MKYKPNDEEIGLINRYISSDSYKINSKLRENIELSDFEKIYVRKFKKLLKKIPTTKHKKLVRDLCFYSKEAREAFLKQFQTNEFYVADSFMSTTKNKEYNDRSDVRIIIKNANKAEDISRYCAPGENEALYSVGSVFRVVSIKETHRKDGSKLHVINLSEKTK